MCGREAESDTFSLLSKGLLVTQSDKDTQTPTHLCLVTISEGTRTHTPLKRGQSHDKDLLSGLSSTMLCPTLDGPTQLTGHTNWVEL